MSTKTTFKRIALVAVAALGFGMVTTVSANAALVVGSLSAGTSAPARVNTTSGSTTITVVNSTTGTDAQSISAQIVSAPTTSVNAVLSFANGTTTYLNGSAASTAVTVSATASSKTDQLVAGGIAYATYTPTAVSKNNFKVTLKADVAGTYQILVSNGSTDGYSAGDKSVTYSITTVGAPTVVSVSKLAGSVIGGTDSAPSGAVLAVTLKDAAGLQQFLV